MEMLSEHYQEFKPVLISRQGEITAWLLTVVFVGVWFLLRRAEISGALVAGVLALVMLLPALSISLGNWLDRKTVLRLDAVGIAFENGLRHIVLRWEEVQAITVAPTRGSARRITVDGTENREFSFQTLANFKYNNATIGQSGFAHGEYILNKMLQHTQLEMTEQTQPDLYYYSRK